MTDVVSSDVRSRMMAGIRGKNTKPEIFVRSQLHILGFRFRLHDKSLPGKPDIVLKKYRAVVFVHGCFWHRHQCSLFKWPKTRKEFWRNKINKNYDNDRKSVDNLRNLGWRVCIVWECAIRKDRKRDTPIIANELGRWLIGNSEILEISE